MPIIKRARSGSRGRPDPRAFTAAGERTNGGPSRGSNANSFGGPDVTSMTDLALRCG